MSLETAYSFESQNPLERSPRVDSTTSSDPDIGADLEYVKDLSSKVESPLESVGFTKTDTDNGTDVPSLLDSSCNSDGSGAFETTSRKETVFTLDCVKSIECPTESEYCLNFVISGKPDGLFNDAISTDQTD
jgi:hypothetical protein